MDQGWRPALYAGALTAAAGAAAHLANPAWFVAPPAERGLAAAVVLGSVVTSARALVVIRRRAHHDDPATEAQVTAWFGPRHGRSFPWAFWFVAFSWGVGLSHRGAPPEPDLLRHAGGFARFCGMWLALAMIARVPWPSAAGHAWAVARLGALSAVPTLVTGHIFLLGTAPETLRSEWTWTTVARAEAMVALASVLGGAGWFVFCIPGARFFFRWMAPARAEDTVDARPA